MAEPAKTGKAPRARKKEKKNVVVGVAACRGHLQQHHRHHHRWPGECDQLVVCRHEVRPSVLYNPSTRSANFFIPGLVAILLQVMTILLIALSLVRERERGTLEQLRMTPIAPLGLMVGKMVPYGCLAFGELCLILTVMRFIFQVPIHGSVVLLLFM